MLSATSISCKLQWIFSSMCDFLHICEFYMCAYGYSYIDKYTRVHTQNPPTGQYHTAGKSYFQFLAYMLQCKLAKYALYVWS